MMQLVKWSKFGVILLGSGLLMACQKPHDYSYYLSHPDILEKTYARCSELSGPAAYADEDCVAAINAAQAIKIRLMDATSNPEAFGVELLHLQTTYAEKKQALEALLKQPATDNEEKNKLIAAQKEELQQMKDDIQARQTVIGLVRTNLR